VIIRSILDWLRCILAICDFIAHPHNSIPLVGIGSNYRILELIYFFYGRYLVTDINMQIPNFLFSCPYQQIGYTGAIVCGKEEIIICVSLKSIIKILILMLEVEVDSYGRRPVDYSVLVPDHIFVSLVS
jgi:hypothetical protein